jgi:hypothetical protein
MKFVCHDGGRAAAGWKGHSGDCVVRAIAIAAELPYQEVYDAINLLAQSERTGKRKRGKSSARDGVYKVTTRKFLESLGWTWTPTMLIGSGCKVHLHEGELPMGRLIVSVSKHVTCVIDGVIYDTHDPQRATYMMENGVFTGHISRRCVYGYFEKKANPTELP